MILPLKLYVALVLLFLPNSGGHSTISSKKRSVFFMRSNVLPSQFERGQLLDQSTHRTDVSPMHSESISRSQARDFFFSQVWGAHNDTGMMLIKSFRSLMTTTGSESGAATKRWRRVMQNYRRASNVHNVTFWLTAHHSI